MEQAHHEGRIALRLDSYTWIATQIEELGIDSPWVKGDGEIKKVSLYFATKF